MTTYKRSKLKNAKGEYIVTPSMADMVYHNDGVTVENKYTDLKNEINENFSKTNAQLSEKISKKYKVDYKSVSGTISNSFTITDNEIDVAKRCGLSICVCPMTSVSSATDSNISVLPEDSVTECLSRIKNKNVEISMLKPHIGLNFSDTLNRANYNPSDKVLFFANWKKVLMEYAKTCDSYSIPILCVSVEMVVLTKNAYHTYWEDIYKTIKSLYPNLLIIHAPKNWEFASADVEDSLKWCDILASTYYTNYSKTAYTTSDEINVSDINKAFYTSEENNFNFMDIVEERCKKYNKKFFIAEIGCMALEDGLVEVVPKSYKDGSRYTNYNVQSELYKEFFENICSSELIVGFSIWHLREPFDFWNKNVTSAEKTITDYCKGGIV